MQSKTIFRQIKTKQYQEEFVVGKNENLTLVFLLNQPTPEEVQIKVRLVGRDAKAQIIGLVSGKGKNNLRLNTFQLHEAQNSTSDLLVKSVLTDQARFNYHGIIRIEKSGQKSDAYQRNVNLLLSKEVRVESQPDLEILANDVRCTHGVATNKPDEQELWYLHSRGISQNQAEKLIVNGFWQDAINRISDKIVQKQCLCLM